MVLVQKQPFFDLFLLGNITQENVCYDILERKNAFLGYKNKKSQKSENRHFSKEVIPGFWFINGKFLNFFFGNKGHGNVFYDIVERQNAFLGNKNKKFKKSKIDIFLKWLVNPWFCPENGCFFKFLSQAIQARKMFFMIFQNEKTFFQALKTRSSKTQKIDLFAKGLTHGFGPKMAIFQTFFLGNIAQENVCYDILEPKSAFLGY